MTVKPSNLNLYQGASFLGLPPATVYLLASGGAIPFKRVNGEVTLNRDLLVSWARLWGERLKVVYSTEGGGR